MANRYSSSKSNDCKPQQLTAIGNRLLDWFSKLEYIHDENELNRFCLVNIAPPYPHISRNTLPVGNPYILHALSTRFIHLVLEQSRTLSPAGLLE
uniref:Uncharacterized protein n=1 Tax=Megaselia scalaris TaxID=36166 RepID=T1GRP0_MEGSC